MALKNGTRRKPAAAARTTPPAVAIVVSRYNATITDRLLEGGLSAYEAAGGDRDDVMVVDAPGAFELPALALAAACSGKVSGVLTLGCVIKGETRHDEYIAHAVAHGVVDVTMHTGIPVAFGVLTTEDVGQAEARAGGTHGNKGAEAMEALLQTIDSIERIHSGRKASRKATARPDKVRARKGR